VSKLIAKGADVNFNKNGAVIELQTGEQVMSATKIEELFVLDMDRKTSVLVTQSKRKSVTFDIWYRRLAYTGTEKLKEMIMHRLVDRLNVHRDLKLDSQCEDCIFENTLCPHKPTKVIGRRRSSREYTSIFGVLHKHDQQKGPYTL